ncbi:MAG: hypothetical protein V2A65_10610 [Candidatus Omnitrophota bacterium]
MTMQYFKPDGNFFVGDCMPFFHDGTFRLYYLLDEGHFGAAGGLGGHQWAQASTEDLVHWTHHPLAIPITEEREGSICTGSVFFHDGMYYGFYATRRRDLKQHISLAKSKNGIHFTKTSPNPLVSPPPGYNPCHYRDPVVFHDPETGLFHMLVTALLDDYPLAGRGGCLEHLVSRNLVNWEHKEPFLIPGFVDVPECPDYFFWNGWYYLVFSNGGVARYRMSRQPLGSWSRPTVDILDGGFSLVMKTAAFTGNRRIGVSWLGGRVGEKDSGAQEFAGNAVFRELVQHADGTLGTRFLPEMLPQGRETFTPAPDALTTGTQCKPGNVRLDAPHGMEAALLKGVPRNFRITAEISGVSGTGVFGLRLRRSGNRTDYAIDRGYDVCLDPTSKTVQLHAQVITRVEGLQHPFRLDLIAVESLIDLCLDNRRCLIDRCPEQQGDSLLFYAWDAAATFNNIRITAL